MAIGAIGGISSSSMSRIQPLRYSLNNQSQVSDDFAASPVAKGGVEPSAQIGKAAPVSYPNAQAVPERTPKEAELLQAEESQKASAAFNRLASAYSGTVTGYGRGGDGTSYGMAGASFDMFA